MNHALATVEILELILLEVDAQTLLTSASLVCKYWNDVIQQSAQLQAALFFRPAVASGRHHNKMNNKDHNKTNNKNHNKEARAAAASTHTNPLLLCRFQDLLGSSRDAVAKFGNDERLSRPEASWRRMLIQQPAVRKLGVWRLDIGHALLHGFKNTSEVVTIEGGEGLTMEWLVDYASTLPKGYTWEVFARDEVERRYRLERGKRSFFEIKSSRKEQQDLSEMWRTADVVVKLTRWLEGLCLYRPPGERLQ